MYFFRFTVNSQRLDWPVYLQNGSDVHVNISKNLERVTFTGSALADEQNEFIKSLYSIHEQESALDKELLKAKDSTLINKLKFDREKVNRKRQDYYETWVKSHRNSPFSIAIIYLFMQQTPVAILENLYNDLSQQAKGNNLVTQLIPVLFAGRKNDEQFRTGEQVRNFVLNDTSGKAHSFFKLKGERLCLT